MAKKPVITAKEAAAMIPNGATIMCGGFLACGLYSNTRLATADERKQKFLENQIVNLVEDCSADEIAPTYARLVSELQRGDYKLRPHRLKVMPRKYENPKMSFHCCRLTLLSLSLAMVLFLLQM